MSYESVQAMFSRSAAEFASQVAIQHGGRSVSYGELEAESNRLANFLLASGVGKGSMIGLFTGDPIRIVTGILAVLKAGAVFVPLDPEFPAGRLRLMSKRLEPQWYVNETKQLDKLDHIRRAEAQIVCLDDDAYLDYEHCKHPNLPSDPEAPCSIYFTSGSTGKPKAILGRLKGIDHFIRWEIEAVGARSGTRVSQLASPSFDGFLKDVFVPLCSGGVVCAPERRDIILDAGRLSDWLDIEQVEVLHCVPSVFRALITPGLNPQYFEAMKCVVLTGEPLYPADVKRWMDVFGDRIKLLNIYGTTETTLSKFAYEVKPEDVRRPSIPVGKPIEGSAMIVVDHHGQPCGMGEVGEIYIRTPYRSHGYYDAPALTGEVFIPNPLNNDPSDIVYKTGDYGRLLKGGDLEHLGRRDQQVQIRGVRVELGEIENLLRAHEAVADVAVIDRDDVEGNKFLVAYVTLKNGTRADELRQYLAQEVPEAMLPSAFVELEQLPRTLNGKIDRKALPALRSVESEVETDGFQLSPIEQIVAGIWCDVLRLPSVGRESNFFNLGGHSLLVTQVLSRLRRQLKVELPVRSLFEAPTVQQFSGLVEEQIGHGRQTGLPTIPRVLRGGDLELSYSQRRMWFSEQISSGTSVFNIPLEATLKGPLNVAALEQSFAEIIRRHEDLRTSFPSRNNEPFQDIHAPFPVTLPVVDLQGVDSREQEAKARSLAEAQLNLPFDLTAGPPVRLTLLRYSSEEHTLVCTLHHIISDGWSKGLLINEISKLYEAFCQGKPSPLKELSIQYADFAVWQRDWLAGDALDQELAYWKENLAGAPPLTTLATDRPRPPIQTFNGATASFKLSKDLSEKLKNLSRQQSVTLFMTLLAAFQVMLSRYTSQEDLVVGTTVANRERSEVEGLIGFFVNMLALRVDCSANPPFDELLGQVRETTLKAYAHQRLPFEKLVEELQPERNLSYQPLFQVIFSLQNQPTLSELTLRGLTLSFPQAEVTTAQCDLLLDMSEGSDGLAGGLQYNSDLFERSTAVQMVKHFCNLLEGIAADPKRRLSDLPLLTEEEHNYALREWNQTRVEYPDNSCIHDLFESRVKIVPDATAAVFKDEILSYAQLNRRANQLAHYLRSSGVQTGDLVGICLEHSFAELIAVMAVLKTGAAYLPLEPQQPAPRLCSVLAAAGVKTVLTQQRFAPLLAPAAAPLLCLDSDGDLLAAQSTANLAAALPAESPAYVIYTSGSTGEPKGVVVTHRALVNYLSWAKDFYLQGEALAFPLYSSLAFDLTVTSLYVPLLSGNAVLVYQTESKLAPLAEVLRGQQAGIMKLTPAHLTLLKEEDNRGSGIKRLIVGGEALPAQLAREVYESFGGEVEIYNEYGPTEATVGCMIHKFDAAADSPAFGNVAVPIGTPIQNAQVYVLDDSLNPVPSGVIGELYIGGAGLARGYLRRPDLTAERFVADPSGAPGTRMYRTGDRVRRRHDGRLDFLGRLDEQVKIRGFRIELGEIETTLSQHPAVRKAVVMAHQDLPDDKRLVAYVVPELLPQQDDSELQQSQQVEQWRAVFDEMPTRTPPNHDPTFNITGWESSYKGQPIPDEEMHEWLDSTVARILELQPQRVLEIGCGTGLLLFRIAPVCTRYWATDFSSATLTQLQRQLIARDLPVKLLPRNADNFTEIAAEAFDTVIINSVSQYFPNVDYLVRVLEGAVAAVAAGGAVFIGDVRSLPLLSAFHADVLMSKADPLLSKAQFAQQLQKQVRTERELLIDPEFFTALKQRLPRIARVEVQLKRGHYRNELTRFRYDVTLHVGPEAETPAANIEWVDWQQQSLTLTEVRRLLERPNAPALGISRVPNARLHFANQVLAWLDSNDGPQTAGEFRDSVAMPDSAIEPEQVWELSTDLPYNVELSWSTDDSQGRYDVLFTRCGTVAQPPVSVTSFRPLNTYANDPLQGNFYRQLVVELRHFLKERLPDYMTPSALMILGSLPLTANGKIDWSALPPPDHSRPELEKAYVAPRTPTEEVLTTLWANILGLDRVGIYDNFFDLGGHSLLATQLISRVRNVFQVEAPLHWMFDASTVAAFSQTLIANEPRPGQTDKIALAFQKVKAMKLEKSQLSIAAL